MNVPSPDDLSHLSMLDLFRLEAENQTALLTAGLLELERTPDSPRPLEELMRAAHSLKGAARIAGLDPAVWIAHAMEDCFAAAQHGRLRFTQADVDTLFRGVDLLQNIGRRHDADLADWAEAQRDEIRGVLSALARLLDQSPANTAAPSPAVAPEVPAPLDEPADPQAALAQASPTLEPPERVLRLGADNLNRLLGLAGESLVESRWLRPFAENMHRLKRRHAELSEHFDRLRSALNEHNLPEPAAHHLQSVATHLQDCRLFMNERLNDLEMFDRRMAQLSQRLYLEVLRTRMRPFSDGARRFPRMVRDLARSLGKDVRLEIAGENTQVDRDILEKLGVPLAHLLRNAVDHGCEPPDLRRQLGKPLPAVIRLEARHSAGFLVLIVEDDGAGVDPERVRQTLVRRSLATPAQARQMSEAALLEFLFQPGFTLKESVTEISGRGVGLDIVQNMAKSVRGSVRVTTQPGRGTRFQLQLPLTLSVLRTLLVEVDDEPYAFPLAMVTRTLNLPREQIESLEGRAHFQFEGKPVGLLAAHQLFDSGAPDPLAASLPVVVVGDRTAQHGLVVDRFVGERELVVQPLDPRLGNVPGISAAAFMEDGSPVLIVDLEDILTSVGQLIAAGGVLRLGPPAAPEPARKPKRVLVVDDSLTVRELERKLLHSHGYETEVAVDGAGGWNALCLGQYDLVVTDVDMPGMDGIELTRRIKSDARLAGVRVMIVSYKDREADRSRGLEAGADYYLMKSSFHDEKLLQAVADLIGEAGG